MVRWVTKTIRNLWRWIVATCIIGKEMSKTVLTWAILSLCAIWILTGIVQCVAGLYELEGLNKAYMYSGILSGIFSGLAFLGVLLTLYHQQRESQRQRFESTFFNMMELQQQITTELEYSGGSQPIRGRELFHSFYNQSTTKKNITHIIEESGAEGYRDSEYPTYFDHYFRHLYRILKFINDEEHPLSFEERYKYAGILRGTLSRYELVWLYYNCLFGAGRGPFKELVEKYAFLKNIREDLLTQSPPCKAYMQNKGLVNNSKLSFNDYNYYMTDQKVDNLEWNNEDGKIIDYYIGAFYNKKELPEALKKFQEGQNQ